MSIKVGIIGAGYIASIHVKVLKLITPRVSIILFDTNILSAQSLALRYDCKYVNNVDDLYANSDAVIIATPSSTHYSLVLDLLKKGKHILCEKPMATTLHEADEMYKLSINYNLICAIGFNYRFISILEILKKEMASFGEISKIKISICRLFRNDWHHKEPGVLSDLGVHLIDYIRHIIGHEINLDKCKVNMKINGFEDYDSTVTGIMTNNVLFTLNASRTLKDEDIHFSIEVVGSKGCLKYVSRNVMTYFIERHGLIDEYNLPSPMFSNDFFDFSESILKQDKEWLNAIMGIKSEKLASFYDGYQSQVILNNFYRTNMNFNIYDK